jgi:hypothetical protein
MLAVRRGFTATPAQHLWLLLVMPIGVFASMLTVL